LLRFAVPPTGSLIDSLADALRPLDKFVVKAYFVISLLFMATGEC
jgi:hypothetical protein